MSSNIFGTVIVPIAGPDDAASTARIVYHYARGDSQVIVVHVIEKGEGVPDKASVEQRQAFAEKAYQSFLDVFPDDGPTLEFRTLYGRNVGETIRDAAEEENATSIAFVPRVGSRWIKFLSGDVTTELFKRSKIPVIALPKEQKRIVFTHDA
ncbi:universal stress protein [Haloprofundus sp. MHR1]|uniref:universal stress protein n=1 Tax=Haloprofundus sp. MHR1 TaxID=2572921 RepID=UPI0010BF235C|nr:universal stress protein [Haloprofundus sp. MHR1]QCJ45946.1 universal stress protein [Haloprofundus sp. MHR1]